MLAPQSVHGICTFAAGGLAGAAANIITCPLDVIRINMQARANVGSEMQQIHTPLSMASKIVAEQGYSGLYRGLSLQLFGVIPNRAFYFWAYGETKDAMIRVIGDCPVTHMASAAAATCFSATVTTPLWTIKTRMQLQLWHDTSDAICVYLWVQYSKPHKGTQTRNSPTGTSIVDTGRGIVASSGLVGLYRGLRASYWGSLEGALQFLMYEWVKKAMERKNEFATGEPARGLSSLQYLLAAGATKGLASALTYPHEVVKTRLREESSRVSRYKSMLQSLLLIAKEEGRGGLYAGLGPHLLRVVPNTALMFMFFEIISKHLQRITGGTKQPLPP